jgi:hypothetical protein
MPQPFQVPAPWGARGWGIKIRDRERIEEPHVSVFFKTTVWRFGLRSTQFLDVEPDPGDVPRGLLRHLEDHLEEYVAAWDAMYPENPVASEEEAEKDENA